MDYLWRIFSPPLEGKMFIIIEGIFIALIIMLPISLVFGRENSVIVKEGNKNISVNSNNTKLTIIIMVCINCICHVIDYLLNTDMISAVTYHKNGGMTFSFVGIFILIVASILVIVVRKTIIEYLDKKEKSVIANVHTIYGYLSKQQYLFLELYFLLNGHFISKFT